jgi:hypothetical protein
MAADLFLLTLAATQQVRVLVAASTGQQSQWLRFQPTQAQKAV